ncbi:hypothetical protein [Bacillus sp. NEB1478]|uniref:hypothetical protein n=1 Tax=Bacillus sp. NEB1478 TaxID=3073816 RepID=UPI002873E699|nr:hypothetical protein [Bacillus sp. NEB1478]WNB92995.1 hypothetical protein RGB74_04795 [Bacillus sp. NEB1478]
MYQYGFMNYFEGQLEFNHYDIAQVGPWYNVYLSFDITNIEILPEGISEPSALIVFDKDGEMQEIIAHDEGVDCEYKFTDQEKDQIVAFLQKINVNQYIVKE